MNAEIGDVVGRLTVVECTRTAPTRAVPYGRAAIRCRCECGAETTVTLLNLGRTQSCGCYRREKAAADNHRMKSAQITRHGLCGTYLWTTYRSMVQRCHNPRSTSFRWYGARGISVCAAWRADAGVFGEYIRQCLGPRPEGYSLDRINNDGDYEPGNVRWASRAAQAANRRKRAAA